MSLPGIIDEVRRVLLREWDPIGIRDEPGAQDEYDSYAPEIVAMIVRGASPARIAGHLIRIETVGMMLPPRRQVARDIARRLCALAH